MIDTRTASILERVPAILAVTANSYGLSWQAGNARRSQDDQGRRRTERNKGDGKPAAQR